MFRNHNKQLLEGKKTKMLHQKKRSNAFSDVTSNTFEEHKNNSYDPFHSIIIIGYENACIKQILKSFAFKPIKPCKLCNNITVVCLK